MSDEEESLAKGRDKRSNAGARMSKLLDAEEEDDFYKTTYGGFEEEAGDIDYSSEASESDQVDSDFSIDENDEVKSDDDDDQPKRKRRGVDTKAYKEPKKPKPKTDHSKSSKPKSPKVKHSDRSSVQIYHSPARKTLRHTTSQKSAQAIAREQEREVKIKMLKEMAAKKNVSEVRRLTQEELLAEARITEQINLKSLETYQRMELEKKKARGQKQVYRGPIIRYQSTTMPLIEDITQMAASAGGGGDAEINVEEEMSDNGHSDTAREVTRKKPSDLNPSEKCSRTFVTFTDEKTFKDYFPQKRCRVPVKQYCAVTRLPAKYFDPITQVPYANAQAFRLIREAYAQQIESSVSDRKRGSRTPVLQTA